MYYLKIISIVKRERAREDLQREINCWLGWSRTHGVH